MQVGWLLDDKQFHIAKIDNNFFSRKSYITLCEGSFLNNYDNSNIFMWPDGRDMKEFKPFSKDTLCNECVSIYIKKHSKETFNFEFIKLKLGVK